MRNITIRGVPDEICELAREEAQRKGVSLNAAYLSLLRKGAQERPEELPASDRIRSFDAHWTEEEAKNFDDALKAHRKIDDELW